MVCPSIIVGGGSTVLVSLIRSLVTSTFVSPGLMLISSESLTSVIVLVTASHTTLKPKVSVTNRSGTSDLPATTVGAFSSIVSIPLIVAVVESIAR